MALCPLDRPGGIQSGLPDARACTCCRKRGDKPEWQHTQDYWAEKDAIPAIDLDGSGVRLPLSHPCPVG